MSVTIPTAFDLEDITVGDGIASGQQITAGGLVTLAGNHNFIGGNYRPPVGELFDVDGFETYETSGGPYFNLAGVAVPEEVNGRGMTFVGVFSNTSTSNVCSFRLSCGSNSGAAVSVAVSSPSVTVTLTCDTPTSGNFAAVIQATNTTGDQYESKLLCGSFFWSGYTGSQSSVPLAGGFVWAQSAEFQDTFPLNVEQVNRFIGGPLTAWNSEPQGMGGLHFNWSYRAPSQTSTTYAEIGRIMAFKRRPSMKIKIAVIGTNATLKASFPTLDQSDVEVVTTGGGGSHNVAPGSVVMDFSGPIDLQGTSDLFEVIIYMKSTVGSAAAIQDVNILLDKS
tara:strand:- start:720 stop:1727 length:1008 start_codon:yes stop_codon:yes gene_type:complete